MCLLVCENKGGEGECNLSVGDLFAVSVKLINCGQPVYIASLAQHVVVTRARWYGTELFPPFLIFSRLF